MTRKILLIEPNYKNKYPPMGLMKIATYHKLRGDEVRFYKGEFKDFVLDEIFGEVCKKFNYIDESVNWEEHREDIITYIQRGLSQKFEDIVRLSDNKLISENLKYYRKYYKNKEYEKYPKWDRVCITTLFTFYWKKTIDTINEFKVLCKDINEVKVGGIAASLVPKELEKETGIKPHIGLLDSPGIYDKGDDKIIDQLPLDYSILNEISYTYPENEGYYAYMTRGCVNKCKFCAVPKLEPEYKCFIGIKKQIEYIDKMYGPKKNLLLLDNNVLASEKFDEIIDEIKACGFFKGATFIEPNQYEIAYRGLIGGYNDRGYIQKIISLYKQLYKKLPEELKSEVYNLLYENNLLELKTANKERIIHIHEKMHPIFIKYNKSKPKKRYVDFNQGIDARLINEHNVSRLAEIPIFPLRIAFDSWKLKDVYERAVRLAAKAEIKDMSNYLLYNFEDKPIDLYRRMRLNVELCEELKVNIYSFPMKYHPIQDPEYFRNRDYIGKYWTRKFIRCIQAVLNSTKGKIGRGKSFFIEAFGKDEKAFEELLYMPETLIIYRQYFKKNGVTDRWKQDFNKIKGQKKEELKRIIEQNKFDNIDQLTEDEMIRNVLKYYTITRDQAEKNMQGQEK